MSLYYSSGSKPEKRAAEGQMGQAANEGAMNVAERHNIAYHYRCATLVTAAPIEIQVLHIIGWHVPVIYLFPP